MIIDFGFYFFNCGSTCDLTDVPVSIYDRKTVDRPFHTIHDILQSLGLAQSLLKGRNALIWRSGKRVVIGKGYHQLCALS